MNLVAIVTEPATALVAPRRSVWLAISRRVDWPHEIPTRSRGNRGRQGCGSGAAGLRSRSEPTRVCGKHRPANSRSFRQDRCNADIAGGRMDDGYIDPDRWPRD